mmetsp:Transcript_5531/g.10385  ORF Transcript_5531/g.10385 Transcript_5531/m.10385 type:complete len:538 (-) Transcript_5531:179-1792(-)
MSAGTCGQCYQEGTLPGTLSLCTGCRSVAYCSKECQRSAWKSGHRSACATLTDKKTTGHNNNRADHAPATPPTSSPKSTYVPNPVPFQKSTTAPVKPAEELNLDIPFLKTCKGMYDPLFMKAVGMNYVLEDEGDMALHGEVMGAPLFVYSLFDLTEFEQGESGPLKLSKRLGKNPSSVGLTHAPEMTSSKSFNDRMVMMNRWFEEDAAKKGEPFVAPDHSSDGSCQGCSMCSIAKNTVTIDLEHVSSLVIHDWLLSPTTACRNLWAYLEQEGDVGQADLKGVRNKRHSLLLDFAKALKTLSEIKLKGISKLVKFFDDPSTGMFGLGGCVVLFVPPSIVDIVGGMSAAEYCIVCGTKWNVREYFRKWKDSKEPYAPQDTSGGHIIESHKVTMGVCSKACDLRFTRFHAISCPNALGCECLDCPRRKESADHYTAWASKASVEERRGRFLRHQRYGLEVQRGTTNNSRRLRPMVCFLPGCDLEEPSPRAFRACSGCKIAHYCSAEHQKQDWKERHLRAHQKWAKMNKEQALVMKERGGN